MEELEDYILILKKDLEWVTEIIQTSFYANYQLVAVCNMNDTIYTLYHGENEIKSWKE